MPIKIYTLKPHHIKFLYGFLKKGEEGIRTDVNSPYPELFTYPDKPEEKYNPEFVDRLISFCNELIGNKKALLKVADGGIDDICLLGTGCNKRRSSCEGRDYREYVQDIKDLFGLKPSKRRFYRVSDVVERMQRVRDAS